MEPFAGIVLSLLLAPTLASHRFMEETATHCFDQRGIALGWVQPFSFCGILTVIVEGLGPSPNYFPMKLYSGCMMACASADQQQVHLQFKWCSNITEPALMLPEYIHDLDITVAKHRDLYKFYGCGETFRAMFEIVGNSTCYESSCRPQMAFVGQLDEMRRTYGFHSDYATDKQRQRSGAILGRSMAPTGYPKGWFTALFTSFITQSVQSRTVGNIDQSMDRLAVAGLLLASCAFPVSGIMVLDAQELDCSKPAGVPLNQIEPFQVCGELMEIVEGESATLNYYPLASNQGSTTACVEVNVSLVYFAIDWCSKLVMPVLMLNRYIQQVDFSVDRDPNVYMFFGCSDRYRTKFQIMPNVTSPNKTDCLTVVTYARDRNEPRALKHSRKSKMWAGNQAIFNTPEKITNGLENVGPMGLPSHWVTVLFALRNNLAGRNLVREGCVGLPVQQANVDVGDEPSEALGHLLILRQVAVLGPAVGDDRDWAREVNLALDVGTIREGNLLEELPSRSNAVDANALLWHELLKAGRPRWWLHDRVQETCHYGFGQMLSTTQ
uniref:Uncharacterized protein n=1 Tax=Anopheles atroparvus TaxID=41427 RepID=A0A182IW35_ANOAO